MSATLNFKFGLEAYESLLFLEPTLAAEFSDLGVLGISREWHGARQGGWRQCGRVRFRLPGQCGHAWRFLKAIGRYATSKHCRDSMRRNSFFSLWSRLAAGLGYALYPCEHGDVNEITPAEAPFLAAIDNDPDDQANWAIYADFLTEQYGAEQNQRGAVIHGWLGPKPLKTKYGVPVIARKDYDPNE